MNQPKVKYSLSNWDLVSVNPNYKTWDWKDLFCFWGVSIQSIIAFSLIAALYIVYDLNTFVVFFGTILGSFFVYLFSNFIGKPSQKFGLPFAVLLRSSLGFKGAEYFGLLRSIVGIFMFGIPSGLSFGAMSDFKLMNMTFFDHVDNIASNYLLPLGGMLTAIFVGWIWGTKNATEEIQKEVVKIANKDLNFFSRFIKDFSKDMPFFYGLFSILFAVILGISAAFIRRFLSSMRKKYFVKSTK